MIIRKDKPGLDAVRIPTDFDIAWAAGVYEGEGSCVTSGGHKTRSFAVSLHQKDPEVLYRLRDLFGGSVKEYPNDRGTNLYKQPFTIYVWRICGDRARVFLAITYSYLTSRRKAQIDATSARIFLDLVGAAPREGALAFVSSRLAEHVSHQRALRVERKTAYQKKFYEDRKSDPSFMEKRREQTRIWRERGKVIAIA